MSTSQRNIHWRLGLSKILLVWPLFVLGSALNGSNPAIPLHCRLCDINCLTVPKADGGCDACICDGFLLSDCPLVSCPENCNFARNEDGCSHCICDTEDQIICPAVPQCELNCQQKRGRDGCPFCHCFTDQSVGSAPPGSDCPETFCEPECTEILGDDGCPKCRCAHEVACPALRSCLLGCIEKYKDSDCYRCNCTLPNEPVTATADKERFGAERQSEVSDQEVVKFLEEVAPLDLHLSRNRTTGSDDAEHVPRKTYQTGHSEQPSKNQPPFGLNMQPEVSPRPPDRQSGVICGEANCSQGCRLCIQENGCGRCVCGHAAQLCPAVPICPATCITRTPSGCFVCTCGPFSSHNWTFQIPFNPVQSALRRKIIRFPLPFALLRSPFDEIF